MKLLMFPSRRSLLTAAAAFLMALSNVGHAQTTADSSIIITQPADHSTFTAPTNIQIVASIYDELDRVAYVIFSASPPGGVYSELGVVSNGVSVPPRNIYSFVWTNAPVGKDWSLIATAIRTNGTELVSAPVQITVQNNFSVAITSPANGSFFPGPTNIDLLASVSMSNDLVTNVEFFDGSQPIGNGAVMNASPVALIYSFDWTNQSLGKHVLTAVATDTNGDTAASNPVTIIVGLSTNPPATVLITQPTNGSTFFAPTNVQFVVSVYDPADDVASVSFTARPAGSGILPPYVIYLGAVSNFVSLDPDTRVYMFDWSNALIGTWSIGATAARTNGTDAGSDSAQITVLKNYSFSVDIASPTNGAVFPGPATIDLIAGVVATNDAAAFVEFFDGSHSLGVVSNGVVVDPPGSPGLPPGSLAYSLDWTNQSLGSHIITAIATDTNGNTVSSEPVKIFVGSASDFSPIVRITSPQNMAVFRAPVNVSLVAYANDSFEPVQSVEFFAGTNGLGFGQPLEFDPGGPGVPYPATNPPTPILLSNTFVLTWTNPAPGAYALTALATDDDGAASTSAPVNITILPAPPPPTNLPEVVSIVATDPIAIAGTNCWSWLGGPLTWSNWMSPTALWRWYTNCGPSDATITVTRRGGTNSDLTVDYSIGGTATNGVDYVTLPGSVTIPAGQNQAAITIVPIDSSSNLSSTVILTLAASTNSPVAYSLGFPRSAEAIIIDNPVPQLAPGGTVLPDRSFHFWLPGPDGAWFHIDYTTDLLNWTTLCTNQVINGSIDFVDPDASASPWRDYRAVPLANPPSD